jgi:hypothetical protein
VQEIRFTAVLDENGNAADSPQSFVLFFNPETADPDDLDDDIPSCF